jgi:tetratricopeptide (TPR) repeat protein
MAIVVAAVFVVDRSRSDAAAGGGTAGQVSAPVSADTSGSYRELVARANGLYDQGAQASQSGDASGAAQYFAAAATVYSAAWGKQPGDPNVGTDFATSLFYSGDTAAALKQVDVVLAKTPGFQSGRLNKGLYLQTASQVAQQNGQSAKATKLLAQARAELEKAVAIDPASAAGKKAAEILGTL